MYKGYWALFWRDVPGWAVYFWGYEFLKRKLGVQNDIQFSEESKRNLFYRFLAGGTAGMASWVVSYPFDVAKSVIQTSQEKQTLNKVFKELCAK